MFSRQIEVLAQARREQYLHEAEEARRARAAQPHRSENAIARILARMRGKRTEPVVAWQTDLST